MKAVSPDHDFNYSYDWSITNYAPSAPFDPPEQYPELIHITRTDQANKIYALVRELFIKLKMDGENIGTAKWNPFAQIVKPGDEVLIKPNLVTDYHFMGEDALLSTVVHGSVLRPVIDYLYKAMRGDGSITIADNPIESADFERIMKVTGIRKMVDDLRELGYTNLEINDLRPTITCEDNNGDYVERRISGNPLGCQEIDLGKDSCFAGLDTTANINYYTLEDKTIDHLDPLQRKKSLTDQYHNAKRHCYVISKTALSADVIINVAKLKTHCKAGVTLALKNLIGIVGTKHCMPHHRPGLPPSGDAFPEYPAEYYVKGRKFYRALRHKIHIHKLPGIRLIINALRKNKVLVGQHIEHGNWQGNDTIWRTILDVNRIALYADKNGCMQDKPQRKIFTIIDGIIGQHGDAPISGEPIQCGIILGGCNSVILDAFATKIMGIDIDLIKTITKAKELKKWPLVDENADFGMSDIETPNLHFVLPKGWR